MQTLFSGGKKRNLLGSGLGMVAANKRYIFWFWLLGLVLAGLGTSAFRESAHPLLDRSLYSEGLTHGFDLSVLIELLFQPASGSTTAMTMPALYFAIVFFLATALFLPGVFQGYASTYRLPREDFSRACGRNLWRFFRLMLIAGLVMGIASGILFGINVAIVKKAGESTNELLPFTLQMTGLAVIFLIMTTLRIWFDLAEVDVVLNDQRAVRKSIGAGFRQTFRSLARLLVSYVVASIFAAILLLAGLLFWEHFIPSTSVTRAFLISQLILLLLLIPRFWQRGVAVSYWQQYMLVPVVPVQPREPVGPPPVPVSVVADGQPFVPDLPPTEGA